MGKLSDRLRREEVTIHVPPTDPGEDAVKQSGAWAASVQELFDERNKYKQRADWLTAQFDSAKHTIERITLEHQHSIQLITNERDYWRSLMLEMLEMLGKLKAVNEGHLAIAQTARSTHHAIDALKQHVEAKPAPVAASFDGNGMPDEGPATVDLDGVRALAEQLAKAQ